MTDTPTARQAPLSDPESATEPRGGVGGPPVPSQALRGAVQGHTVQGHCPDPCAADTLLHGEGARTTPDNAATRGDATDKSREDW